VINSFVDVTESPDGEVFASQHIQVELDNEKYYIYKYDFLSKRWLVLDSGF